VLKDHTPADAVLVRFGGDEFAIGMPSERARAEALAETLRGLQVTVEGVPEPVGYSVGLAGGRRVGRAAEHGAANVDDLINAASRDALARKRESKAKRPRTLHEALNAVMQREDLGEGIIRDAILIDRGADGQMVEVIVSRPNHPEPRIVRRPVKGDLMAALETALRDAIR
jgi:GGDEF domain-containing protein